MLRRARRLKDDPKKPLIAGVQRSLPFRFRRRRLNWWAEVPETTIAINLCARFRPRYHIELGAQPNAFVNPFYGFVPHDISTYGARERGDRLVPVGTDLGCFDLDIPMDPAEREDRVAAVIALLVPYVLEWSTLDGLRRLAADPVRAYCVHDALTEWLGVPLRELPPGSRTLAREGPPAAPPELLPGQYRIGEVIVRPYQRR